MTSISRQVPEEKREEFMVSWTVDVTVAQFVLSLWKILKDGILIALDSIDLRGMLWHTSWQSYQNYNIQVFEQIETGVAT